ERFELTEVAGRPASTYSGGMKRRLDLAMTLVASPRVIFLDEPTTGLDPRSRRTMWQVVRELVAGGITVVLTTQYLDEADELADRVAVLDAGRIVAAGTPEELKRQVPGGHVRLWFADLPALDAASAAVRGADRDDHSLSLTVPGTGSVSSLRALLDQLDRAEVEVDDLAIHTPDLDDVFLAVSDSMTMLRRQLKHMLRYPSMTVLLVGTPVVLLLLFVYVFGGTLGAGLPVSVAGSGRAAYLEYVTPGILLLTMAATAQGTAISVAMDMTEGIIARFRTMPIARASVLTG